MLAEVVRCPFKTLGTSVSPSVKTPETLSARTNPSTLYPPASTVELALIVEDAVIGVVISKCVRFGKEFILLVKVLRPP